MTNVLRWHLVRWGYLDVSARIVGNARQRERRGGIKPWQTVRKGILRHLKQDSGCLVTTMVDYYGLPQSGADAWPGRKSDNGPRQSDKAKTVEDALLADVCEHMDANFNPNRFIPYVMMHEYEAMLFSDCSGFSRGIGLPKMAREFQAIRDSFASPEEIDDSPQTAPSKRIKAIVPQYQKPVMGTLAVLEIGIEAIRRECPHFGCWLNRLEAVPTASSGQSATDLR